MPKYYAVARGRQTGVYTSWSDAEPYVRNYPYAKFKEFTSKKKAEDFVVENAANPDEP